MPFKIKYVRGNDQQSAAIMNRTKLKNMYYKHPTEENMRKLKKQRNFCVKLLRETKKDFYSNLDARQITDNRKFWKNVKPLFSTKTINASNIILFDNDKIIRNEADVAEKFNNYFSNVVETLNIPEIDAVTIISDHIADPIDQAIYKYSKHPSTIAIKEKCASNIKFSF